MTKLEVVEELLNSSVSGFLCVKREHKTIRYYRRENSSDKNGKYLGKNQSNLIRDLEKKNYLIELKNVLEVKAILQARIREIEKEMPDEEAVFLKIPPEKRHLIQPYTFVVRAVNDKDLKTWNKKPFRKKSNDIRCFTTQKGEKVRSKSELIIAERLKARGVPYHYEYPFYFYDKDTGLEKCWFPDFKVLNVRTGKEYFWEHFGMLDDEDYRVLCMEKIETYAQYGVVLGKNLIVSAESRSHNINVVYIDFLIEEFLI